MNTSHEIWLTADDIKEWYWCPRVLFFRYYSDVSFLNRMYPKRRAMGRQYLSLVKRLHRNLPFDINIEDAEYSVLFSSDSFMLSGVVDIIITDRKGISYPVTCCYRMSRRSRSAAVLVGAYHFLMQSSGRKVNGLGFAIGIDCGRSMYIDVSKDSIDIEKAMDKIRMMIIHEAIPPAPTHRGKCVQCNYIRYCADMF